MRAPTCATIAALVGLALGCGDAGGAADGGVDATAGACAPCDRPCCSYDQTTGMTVAPFCPPAMYECGGPPFLDGGDVDGASLGCSDPEPPAAGLHVTTDGTPGGDGTIGSPWDLDSTLRGDHAIAPGTTIWVHGGTYAGVFTANLAGTDAEPIVVRAVPGERATLDGAGERAAVLTVESDYTWFWGLEITNSLVDDRETTETGSAPSDIVRGDGVNTGNCNGVRFIDLVVHDNSQGISFWSSAVDSEVYGCLVSLNGWDAPDRPHGHAIYTQNETGTKRIEENILFHGFSYGVHAYTEGGSIQGFDFVGNVFFQTGTPTLGGREGGADFLVGGLQPAARIRLVDNFGYSRERDRTVVRLGYSVDNEDVTVTGNYIAGRTSFGAPWSSIEMTGNTFVGAVDGDVDTTAFPDNTYLADPPTETAVFVRPNRYEPNRGHVIVYDWAGEGTVAFDPSPILSTGMAYELRDAQNYYAAPVSTGVYQGGTLSVSLAGLAPAQPVGVPGGIQDDELSTPELAVFVLERVACP